MKLKSTFIAASVAITLLLLFSIRASSHDEPGVRPHHVDLPANPTAVMRAFSRGKLGDDVGVQNLAALADAGCVEGFAGIYPCNNIDLMSFMPLSSIGATQSNDEANDIWGWTDTLSGREFAIIGRVFGTSFIEITDPANPVFIGELDTHGRFGSPWRDIKVYADHAFIVSEASRHGMQVFDLRQLLNVVATPVVFEETAHYRGFGSAHNIVINEDTGFAYGVGTDKCSGGLEMVDISNPLNPTDAGCFASDGYTHDAQCVVYTGPDVDYQGSEICMASNEDTLTIVDVTNKNNPVQISRTSYAGAEYTHQGWFTEDQKYFLLDDELDEKNIGHNTLTRVFNVSNLDAPELLGEYNSDNHAIDHNQYVKGNYVYQANYRAGLRILDISDVANANLNEVAYFDIYPDDDAAEFNAAWSNYPYFDSGMVVVSGIEQGLYVLRPNLGGGTTDNPPTVELTSPANGDVVSGSVSITASATDDMGVQQVEFIADGQTIDIATTAPYSTIWNTVNLDAGEYVISAMATDTMDQSTSDSITLIVDNGGVVDSEIHIGDLDGRSEPGGRGGKWNAIVTITVHDENDARMPSATVTGTWSSGATGSGSCVTNTSGNCSITNAGLKRNASSATFSVTNATLAGSTYVPMNNHDLDGDSNGTTILISNQ